MYRWFNHHCSDNGLSPGRRQVIIWIDAEILLIGFRNKGQLNFYLNSYNFIPGNAFENALGKTGDILFRP